MSKELQKYNKNKSLEIKQSAWVSLSEETKKAYQYDYDLFFQVIKKNAKNITPTDIVKFINYLEDNNYKNSSINRKIASLSKMFKIMVLAGEMKNNPVEILKQLKNIVRKTSMEAKISLTLKDIRKAIKVNEYSSIQEHKMSLIIRTLAKTGLRISEFINIKNSDIIDFDSKNVKINILGKGKKERSIFLEKEFIAEIKKYYPDKKGIKYLFYTERKNPYNRKVLHKQISQYFFKKTKKKCHPHMLRHWFATYKIGKEKKDIKAVSRYLGHANVSTTLQIYCDTALNEKDAEIKI